MTLKRKVVMTSIRQFTIQQRETLRRNIVIARQEVWGLIQAGGLLDIDQAEGLVKMYDHLDKAIIQFDNHLAQLPLLEKETE